MLISLPRMSRIARSESFSRSVPPKRMEPAILPGGSGTSRRMEFAVTDFPQPLSPTSASVSPSSTWKDTPSTARLTPSGVRKCVCRFSTSSKAIASKPLGHARIERVAQAVSKQIDRQHGERKEYGGEENDERLYLPQRPPLGHDVAPGRNGGRSTGADEGQDRLDDHGASADVGRLHGQRRQRVRQDMP